MRLAFLNQLLGCVAICLAGCAANARGAETNNDAEYRKAKPAIQQQLRSKQSADRVEAVRRLADFPQVDAAKLVLQLGFKDRADQVPKAAFETLLAYSGNEEICEFMLATLAKETKRKTSSDVCAPLVAALLTSEIPTVQTDTVDFIDKSLIKNKDGLLNLIMVADQLGDRGGKADRAALERMTKLGAFESEFGLRRAVVDGLIRSESPEAIETLIGLLATVEGEVQADIVEHLMDVTDQKLGVDDKAWAKWWKENKEDFKFPARARAPFRSLLTGGSGSYYGISIYAQRVVFVIDTSGSMEGARLAAAKRDLSTAVNGLKESVQFSIVAFNSKIAIWQKKLVPATAPNKKGALAFIDSLTARSQTASYDALETAFGFNAEAIYFLSDGEPRGGKIVDPVEIVTVITKRNRTRRESLYTIGIGAGPQGGLFDTFLSKLAEQNHGVYRRVTQ